MNLYTALEAICCDIQVGEKDIPYHHSFSGNWRGAIWIQVGAEQDVFPLQ